MVPDFSDTLINNTVDCFAEATIGRTPLTCPLLFTEIYWNGEDMSSDGIIFGYIFRKLIHFKPGIKPMSLKDTALHSCIYHCRLFSLEQQMIILQTLWKQASLHKSDSKTGLVNIIPSYTAPFCKLNAHFSPFVAKIRYAHTRSIRSSMPLK